ncbi:MAG: YlbF family regulator [Clostridiales bacterium]|nr:YlbF family regulator [Clostridiales bacterium]
MSTQTYAHYLACKQAVESDASLSALIAEYEMLVAKMIEMAADPDYDPAAAVACANDAEYLQDMLEQNPLITALREAEAALRPDCATCTGCCGGCQVKDEE